jgi:hypothetical protein
MFIKLSLVMLFFAEPLLASGATTCRSTSGKETKISWGSTHGIGSPRFGPYQVELDGQTYRFWPSHTNPKSMKTKPGVTDLAVIEVGYWRDIGKILVKLTDDQLMWTMMHLDVQIQPDNSYVGEAVVWPKQKGFTRKVPLKCSVE